MRKYLTQEQLQASKYRFFDTKLKSKEIEQYEGSKYTCAGRYVTIAPYCERLGLFFEALFQLLFLCRSNREIKAGFNGRRIDLIFIQYKEPAPAPIVTATKTDTTKQEVLKLEPKKEPKKPDIQEVPQIDPKLPQSPSRRKPQPQPISASIKIASPASTEGVIFKTGNIASPPMPAPIDMPITLPTTPKQTNEGENTGKVGTDVPLTELLPNNKTVTPSTSTKETEHVPSVPVPEALLGKANSPTKKTSPQTQVDPADPTPKKKRSWKLPFSLNSLLGKKQPTSVSV